MYGKEYRKLCREMNYNLVGLKVKINNSIFNVYEKYNICGCNGTIVKNKSSGKYGIEIHGKKNNASSYGVFWLDPLHFDRTEKLSLVTPMVLRHSGRVGSCRF